MASPSQTPTGARCFQRYARRALGAARALVLLLAGAGAVQAAEPAPDAIEKALKHILKTQPQLVRDALNELQRRDALDKSRQDRQMLAQSAKALLGEVGATVLGNPDGDVTLVEFIDYHCGYCKSLSANIDTLIQRDGRLRVVVKHYPILGPESAQAAQLALAAPRGDSAQQVHRALMAADSLSAPALRAIELQFGITAASGEGSSKALAEVRALADKLGIQGTPAIVIGGTLIRGAADVAQLEAAIQRARQQKAGPRGTKPPAVASL